MMVCLVNTNFPVSNRADGPGPNWSYISTYLYIFETGGVYLYIDHHDPIINVMCTHI